LLFNALLGNRSTSFSPYSQGITDMTGPPTALPLTSGCVHCSVTSRDGCHVNERDLRCSTEKGRVYCDATDTAAGEKRYVS